MSSAADSCSKRTTPVVVRHTGLGPRTPGAPAERQGALRVSSSSQRSPSFCLGISNRGASVALGLAASAVGVAVGTSTSEPASTQRGAAPGTLTQQRPAVTTWKIRHPRERRQRDTPGGW